MLTLTASTTNRPARLIGWVRGRLAPTGEDLEERASWRVKTRWILGAWAVLSAVSAVGTALTPVLLAFPVALVAFTPRLPFLFLAATTANPVLFFGVAVPRMLLGDPIHIALGRRYGGRFVPRRALRPTSKVLAAAGACKLRTSRVLTADAVGTIGLLASIYIGTSSIVG
jgi:hypothetical protein